MQMHLNVCVCVGVSAPPVYIYMAPPTILQLQALSRWMIQLDDTHNLQSPEKVQI